MAQISLQPFIMRDVLLTLGTAGDYEKHVKQVQFDPSSSVVNWKGLSPDSVFSFGTSATWTCTLAYAQDWDTADSLSRYLFEHEGEDIAATFEPVKDGPSITATLIVSPGSIGGAVDAVAEASVTLGVKGKPVLEALA
jgi:hypothetical protein